jgi:hypothetical protein
VAARPTPEQQRQMMEGTVAAQFETIAAAARGCDAIVGATALQIATPSIAESMGIPYFFAAYCPAVLPSPHHAPPVLAMLGGHAGTCKTRLPRAVGPGCTTLERPVEFPDQPAPGKTRPGSGRGCAQLYPD